MAKTRTRYATGLSIQNILDMPISELQDLPIQGQREVISRLVSAANKRVRNLEKSNTITPALQRLKHSGDKLSVKGKSGDELIKEFVRARSFIESKTSSLREWKRIVKQTENIETEIPSYDDNDYFVSMSEVFSIFDEIREYDGTLASYVPSDDLLGYMANLADTGFSIDEIFSKTVNWLKSEYARLEQESSQYTTRFADRLKD